MNQKVSVMRSKQYQDPLQVLIGLVKRLRAKMFKNAFNGLLQDILIKVDFKKILNDV